jgi:NAD(P)-dependent dehydrogenase (short-subunit alcohol dehydrogenase family)
MQKITFCSPPNLTNLMTSNSILAEQKIVVIGGTGALGSTFLRTAERQGAKLCVAGRRRPDGKVPFREADITNLESMIQVAAWAKCELGKIDTVINFAGTHHRPMNFTEDDPHWALSEYKRVMEVNIDGAFILTLAFSNVLIEQRWGHIIHLCSNASRLSLHGSYAYNISKHGLDGLIKTSATQLAPFGVRINGIAPGTIETDLNRGLLRTKEGTPSLRASAILAHTPSKKFATADGIAESLVALCIPQRHLTGNIIFCDDGYNVEGHSWPEGTKAVYTGAEELERILSSHGSPKQVDTRS